MSEEDPWAEDSETPEEPMDFNFVTWIMGSLRKAASEGKLFDYLPHVAVLVLGFNAGYKHTKNLMAGIMGSLSAIIALKLATTDNNLPAQTAGLAALGGIGLLNVASFAAFGELQTEPGQGQSCPPGYELAYDVKSNSMKCFPVLTHP